MTPSDAPIGRQLRRLLASIAVAAAAAGTIGHVRNHRGAPVFEAAIGGEAREVGGLNRGRRTTERLLGSDLVAEYLSDRQIIRATATQLSKAVTVELAFPHFTIRARGNSPGYAAVLARSWATAINPVLGIMVRQPPASVADTLELPPSARSAAMTALTRERTLARQPVTATIDPRDPLAAELVRLRASVYKPVDLVAVESATRVPVRTLNRSSIVHLLPWLAVGAAAGLLIALFLAAVSGACRRFGWAVDP